MVVCLLCNKEFKQITQTHLNKERQGMIIKEYLQMFNTPLLNEECKKEISIKKFGKKMSEAQKKKQSQSMLGKEAWNKGLTKETDERIANYSKKLIEREFSEIHRKKLSNSMIGHRGMIGEDNPMWKGGISFEQMSLRNSKEVGYWVKRIYKKFGRKCWICDSDYWLNAHHIHPIRTHSELATEDRNGVVLCVKHHRQHETDPTVFDRIFNYEDYEPYVHPQDEDYGSNALLPLEVDIHA